MRAVSCLVFALFLAPALHSEDSAPLDFEFERAVEAGKPSVREILRRLNAATRLAGTPAEPNLLYYTEAYSAAARRGTSAELDKLGELLRAMPAGSFYFKDCFSAYATAQIRRRVAQLGKKPLHLEWPPDGEPLPKELVDAPASFRDAWKLHCAVMAPYQAVVEPWEEMNTSYKVAAAFEMDLRKVIGAPERGSWKHLLPHRWAGQCWTGSEWLYHPRNRALLLSFLADGELHESAGAALAQVHSSSSSGNEDPFEFLVVDLFTALGVDWEQVMFGSLVPVTSYNAVNRKPVVSSGFTECDAWRLLATRGSERAVRQCLDLIRWAKLDPRNAGEFLAAALGPEPKQPGVITLSSNGRLVRRTALPQQSRSEIVAAFAWYLAPANSSHDLMDAMSQVPWSCAKDLRSPLSALLSHRMHAVASKARSVLEEAGLASGQEAIAPATPPLLFRILLNGKPMRGLKFSVDAIAKTAAGADKGGAGPLAPDVTVIENSAPGDGEQFYTRAVASSQDLTTDGNGEVRYSLEDCLEPERIASIQFRIGPPQYSSERDDGPQSPFQDQAQKQPTDEWPGPWIVHQAEAHPGDKRVHEVELRTTDMEIKLAAFAGITPDMPIRLTLRRTNSRAPFSPEAGVAKVTAKVGSRAFFRQLQPGKYILGARAPGAANYDSGEITVGDAAVTQDVKLEAGRNVRGTAVYPGGFKDTLLSSARLFRDGVEVPREDIDEWKGLRFGKYTPHIPSTREWEEENKKAGAPPSRIAEEDRVEGCEVSFVIDSSTPATLDLGEIIVPREK